MKILFIVPYPVRQAPSQRFRFEQYLPLLTDHSNQIQIRPFLQTKNWKLFYKKGHTLRKTFFLIRGFIDRLLSLFTVSAYDLIFIHREATPIGPPFFEWFVARVFKKKIIYDFDDALWITDRKDEPKAIRWLKWRSKIKFVCRWSHVVSCGNAYLKSYASMYNSSVVVNPTTIDTQQINEEIIKKDHTKITIGWTGTHSTLKYLHEKEPVLLQIQKKYPTIEFVFISDIKPEFDGVRFTFKQWNLENEIDDLVSIDIGTMPLPDDAWTRGKCGFKALQFMALGIPCVVSPVGVNSKIVDHGVNGFLATSDAEWITSLSYLIENKSLRNSMGVSGQEKIHSHFSVSSNSKNFLSLFS